VAVSWFSDSCACIYIYYMYWYKRWIQTLDIFR